MTIPENGYLAVYLSNASDFAGCSSCLASEGDVYFDHLEITFTHGHLKEENGYYPFGLPMAGQSSSALGMTPNRQKYQSNEYLTEAGLNWMSFGARQYACPERSRRNPQLGRFLSVDPLAAAGGQESNSPYEAMGDEPVSETDPDGMLEGNITMPPRGDNVSLGIQFAPSTLDIIFGSGSMFGDDENTSDVLDNTDWGNSGNSASAESMGIDIAGIFIDIDDGGTGFSSGIAMDEGPGGAAGDGAPDDKGDGKGDGGDAPPGSGMDMENENKNNGSLSQKEKEQQYIKKVAELKSDISFDKEMIKSTTEETNETGSELELIDRKNRLKGESIKNGEAGFFLGEILNRVIYTYELKWDTEALNKLENSQ